MVVIVVVIVPHSSIPYLPMVSDSFLRACFFLDSAWLKHMML